MRHDFVKHKETQAVLPIVTRATAAKMMGVPEHELPSTKDAWFVKPITGWNYCNKQDAVPCYADGRVKVPHLPELPDHELQLQDH